MSKIGEHIQEYDTRQVSDWRPRLRWPGSKGIILTEVRYGHSGGFYRREEDGSQTLLGYVEEKQFTRLGRILYPILNTVFRFVAWLKRRY